MTRQDFKPWILEALDAHDGRAEIFQVSRFIWDNYHHKISKDKKMLYTWQYEIRWAALSLKPLNSRWIGRARLEYYFGSLFLLMYKADAKTRILYQ